MTAFGVAWLATSIGCTFGSLTMAVPVDDTESDSNADAAASSGDAAGLDSTPWDDDGTSSSGTTASVDDGSSSDDGTTTGAADTEADDTTTGPAVECLDDIDCVEGFVCLASVCINPEEGMGCAAVTDCDPIAPFCENGQCWDGSPGDPCPTLGSCAVGVVCGPLAQCQAGLEGDPCNFASDCGTEAPFCGGDGLCHDGDAGDSCTSSGDCAVGLLCGPEAMCQAGLEGDPCLQNQGHCSLLAPFCPQNDDLCHDGSVGDPCDSGAQCMAGVLCNPDSTCQSGLEGELCEVNGNDCGPQAPFCAAATCWDGSAGDSCNSDNDCAFPLHCNPSQQCQVGAEGAPCEANGNDCSLALAPFCGPDLMCHDGNVGDPCTNGGCAEGNVCTDGLCA